MINCKLCIIGALWMILPTYSKKAQLAVAVDITSLPANHMTALSISNMISYIVCLPYNLISPQS